MHVENVDKVNVERTLALFDDHWNLRIVGELNGQHVKLAKLLGELVCHHDEEDELFFRREGTLSHGVPGSGRVGRGRRVYRRFAWGRTPARCQRESARDAVRARINPQHGQRSRRTARDELEQI